MKKLMMILLVGCLVFAVSGMIFAYDTGTITNDLNTTVNKSVNLTAKVGPWACIQFGTPDVLQFLGYAGEEKIGKVCYSIETNCDALVQGKGTKFSKLYKGHTYELATGFMPVPNSDFTPEWTTGLDLDVPNVQYPFGISSGSIWYKAKLGGVNDQPAGTYSATYKLIVSNPMNVD